MPAKGPNVPRGRTGLTSDLGKSAPASATSLTGDAPGLSFSVDVTAVGTAGRAAEEAAGEAAGETAEVTRGTGSG